MSTSGNLRYIKGEKTEMKKKRKILLTPEERAGHA